jgi:hypothetical protein
LHLPAASEAYRYPDFNEQVTYRNSSGSAFDTDRLSEFLAQWQDSESGGFASVKDLVGMQNPTVAQLDSVYRIQGIQLDQLRRQARPIVSIMTDPGNPLYGFSVVTAPNFAGPPADTTTISHNFGLGAGLSQQLPTAGSLDLTLKHGISVSSVDGGAWKWKQLPSVGLTLRQSLGLGDSWLDTGYGRNLETKQLLQQSGAADAVGQAKNQLSLQVLQFRGTLQALYESKWLATRQAILADDAITEAQADLDLGIISRNQLILKQSAFAQQLLQIAELEREIASVSNTLDRLSSGSVTGSFDYGALIDLEAITALEQYRNGALLSNEALYAAALGADPDYMQADRDIQIARLDQKLGNPADAPTFSVAMQLSPYYTPTAGNGLWGSFDELFSSGDPVFSVSISFMATDLSRSTSRTTRALVDEQLVQASISKTEAESTVYQKIKDLQLRIDSGLDMVTLLLKDYDFAVNDVEIERILAASYFGNDLSIRRKELAMYGAAFSVLQQLRSLTALSAELAIVLGSTEY